MADVIEVPGPCPEEVPSWQRAYCAHESEQMDALGQFCRVHMETFRNSSLLFRVEYLNLLSAGRLWLPGMGALVAPGCGCLPLRCVHLPSLQDQFSSWRSELDFFQLQWHENCQLSLNHGAITGREYEGKRRNPAYFSDMD